MISLSVLADALAVHIQEKTGVAAYAQRLSTAVYPMYSVSLLPLETTLMAGGTQLLRCVKGSISCYPSRHRQEGECLDMADRLMHALLPGFSLCSRHFSPSDCKCREKDNILSLEFTLEFCDMAAENMDVNSHTETMQTLSLSLNPKKET